MIARREGFSYVTALPSDERIVGMVVHNKKLHFATDKGIYKIKKGKAVKIISVSGKEGIAAGCE